MKTTKKYQRRDAETQRNGEAIVNGLGQLQYLPPTHNDPAQGQYNRLIKKREQARGNDFIGLRTKNSRRFWYWERAFLHTYRCDVCRRAEGHECRHATTGEAQPPDRMLCWDHARLHGFCAFCGEYRAGSYAFNFREDGLCYGCREELRECSPPGSFPGPFDLVIYSAPLRLCGENGKAVAAR